MTLVAEESIYNPQTALEAVGTATDRCQALADLASDEEALAAFARWCAEHPVGFQSALAKLTTTKPKMPTRVVEAFAKAVEATMSAQGGRKKANAPTCLAQTLPHPSAEEILIPAGYLVEVSGLYRIDPRRGRELISHYPLILEGYVRDAESDLASVVVAWRANEEWRRMAISRETMGVSADLARVAGQFGAPIHSANAVSVVAYFSAFEALNLAKFEEVQGVSRMGWTTLSMKLSTTAC